MQTPSFTHYDTFQVHQVSENAAEPVRDLGIARLFAHLVALGEDAPISILLDNDENANAKPGGSSLSHGEPKQDHQWSLWGRISGRWFWLVIGATSLDDVVEALITFLTGDNNRAEELRICPPGSTPPRALT